jgi:hypothetical protein
MVWFRPMIALSVMLVYCVSDMRACYDMYLVL